MENYKVTNWTFYEDDKYIDIRDEIKDYDDFKQIKKLIAEEIKSKGYQLSGFSHQNYAWGVPVLNDKYKVCCSMREWGDIMAMAYIPNYEKDDYAYVVWAWNSPIVKYENFMPVFKAEKYPDIMDYINEEK